MFALELFGTRHSFERFRLESSESINDCTTRFVLAVHEVWARCLDVRVSSSTNSLVEIIDTSLAHL